MTCPLDFDSPFERKVSPMLENCSCHTPAPSQDENAQDVKQFACNPCSAKTVKMMLAVLGGIVLIVVVLTQLV